MRNMTPWCGWILVLGLVGCDVGEPQQDRTGGNVGGIGLTASELLDGNTQSNPAAGQAPAGTTTPAAPAPPPEMVMEKAAVGATGKGNYEPGLITTPISAYFRTKERIVFDIAIPHALQLYEALEGHAPKSHEEFMEKIIKFNMIELPELPHGHEYVYDPEAKQLMVRHPKT